jgi:hypothetical protein
VAGASAAMPDGQHLAGESGIKLRLSTMRAASVGVICESQSAGISQLF